MIFDKVLALGILAGALQFVGYLVYVYDVSRSAARPNPASWLIWSYGNAFICLSYILLNDSSDLSAEILPIVCGVTCIIVAIYFSVIGKFRSLTSFEKKVVVFDVLITIAWVCSEFLSVSILPVNIIHILLLISTVITFIPIYKDVFDDPSAEHPRSWFIWSFAYLLLLIVVIIENGDIQLIIYPVLYAVLHGVVGVLAIKKLL